MAASLRALLAALDRCFLSHRDRASNSRFWQRSASCCGLLPRIGFSGWCCGTFGPVGARCLCLSNPRPSSAGIAPDSRCTGDGSPADVLDPAGSLRQERCVNSSSVWWPRTQPGAHRAFMANSRCSVTKSPSGQSCAGCVKRHRNREPAKRWATFLSNHREAIAAMDFFTVPTLTFGMLYCFFVIAHDRRRILHFNVIRHPTGAWSFNNCVRPSLTTARPVA